MFEFFIIVLSFEKWAVLAYWCIKRPAATCEQRLSSGRAQGQSTVRAAGHARVCAWSGLPQFPTLISWQEAKRKMFPKCHRLNWVPSLLATSVPSGASEEACPQRDFREQCFPRRWAVRGHSSSRPSLGPGIWTTGQSLGQPWIQSCSHKPKSTVGEQVSSFKKGCTWNLSGIL